MSRAESDVVLLLRNGANPNTTVAMLECNFIATLRMSTHCSMLLPGLLALSLSLVSVVGVAWWVWPRN